MSAETDFHPTREAERLVLTPEERASLLAGAMADYKDMRNTGVYQPTHINQAYEELPQETVYALEEEGLKVDVGYCWLQVMPEEIVPEAIEYFGREPSISAQELARWLEWRLQEFEPELEDSLDLLEQLCDEQGACAENGWLVHSSIAQLESRLAGTIHFDGVTQIVAGELQQKRKEALGSGSASVPEKLVPLLLKEGVLCSSDSTADHAHGAHKAIENHMYAKVYPPYATKPATCVTQKLAKFEKMQGRNANYMILENFLVEPEDEKRYAGTSEFDPTDVKTPHLWFCDSGHHVTRHEIAYLFSNNPNLERIFLAGIMPGETLRGYSSANPWLYSLRYDEDGEGFDYFLEGSKQGFYHHHQKPWMLHPGVVRLEAAEFSFSFKVTPLVSVFAHTLVAIDRTCDFAPNHSAFYQNCEGLMPIPKVFYENLDFAPQRGEFLFPAKLFRDIVHYLPILRKSEDPASLQAKIRSYFSSPAYEHIPEDVWRQMYFVAYEMSKGMNLQQFTSSLDEGTVKASVRALMTRVADLVVSNPKVVLLQVAKVLLEIFFPWLGKAVSFCTLASAASGWDVPKIGWEEALAVVSLVAGPAVRLGFLLASLGVTALEYERMVSQRRASRVLQILATRAELRFPCQGTLCVAGPERAKYDFFLRDDLETKRISIESASRQRHSACCGQPIEICAACPAELRARLNRLEQLGAKNMKEAASERVSQAAFNQAPHVTAQALVATAPRKQPVTEAQIEEAEKADLAEPLVKAAKVSEARDLMRRMAGSEKSDSDSEAEEEERESEDTDSEVESCRTEDLAAARSAVVLPPLPQAEESEEDELFDLGAEFARRMAELEEREAQRKTKAAQMAALHSEAADKVLSDEGEAARIAERLTGVLNKPGLLVLEKPTETRAEGVKNKAREGLSMREQASRQRYGSPSRFAVLDVEEVEEPEGAGVQPHTDVGSATGMRLESPYASDVAPSRSNPGRSKAERKEMRRKRAEAKDTRDEAAFFREQRGERAAVKAPILSQLAEASERRQAVETGYIAIWKLLGTDPRHHVNYKADWGYIAAGEIDCPGFQELDSCGVQAAAQHLHMDPGLLWEAVGSRVPRIQMLSWARDGCDERWFDIVGILFKVCFGVSGTKLAKAARAEVLLCGVRGQKAAHVRFTDDPPHYEACQVRPRPLSEPVCSQTVLRKPGVGAFDAFLGRLEAFVDSRGAKIGGTWNAYTATAERADMLASEYHVGVAGGIYQLEGKRYAKDTTKRLKFTADTVGSKTVQVRVLSGFAGCGKSSPLQEFLRGEEPAGIAGSWLVGVPRLPLRQDWKDKVKPKAGFLINTFEMLFIRSGQMIITDEHGLLLPGFLDFVALNNIATHFLVLGDETQCQAHNPNENSSLAKLEPEMSYITRAVRGTYWLWTHRSPQWLARFCGVPSSNPVEGGWRFTTTANRRDPLVVASDMEKRKWGNAAYNVFTFSGIQGQTASHVQIVLNKTTLTITSINDFFQAMTRSDNLVSFIVEPGIDISRLVASHPILGPLKAGGSWHFETAMKATLAKYDVQRPDMAELQAIKAKRAASMDMSKIRYFRSPAEDARIDLKELSQGKAFPVRPIDKAGRQCAVWYQGAAATVTYEGVSGLPTGRVERSAMKVHIPSMKHEVFLQKVLPDYGPRCEREIITDRGMSNCFPDDIGFQQIFAMFPAQQVKDEVLVQATFDARLERSTFEKNERDFVKGGTMGTILFNVAREALGLAEECPFDADLFETCVMDQEASRVHGKPLAAIENNDERGDPDKPTNRVLHFIKSQVKKKSEAFYAPKAKPGQSLATCHEAVIHSIGPWVRYLAEKIKEGTRPNVWLHHGKDLLQFDTWTKEHWKQDRASGSLATVNDFSAFDSTQGGESVQMELAWLAWAGCPLDVREAYSYWKTHIVSSRIGVKKTSRDTGEPGTFLFNTLYSIANTALKYGVDCFSSVAFCFGGDDMAADSVLYETSGWRDFYSRHIKTVSKTFHVEEADFCGYILTRQGILRDPFIMLMKATYLLAKGNCDLALPGFAMELSFTYAKGDAIYDLLSFDAVHALGIFLDLVHERMPLTAARYFSAEEDLQTIANKAIARIRSAVSMKGKRAELRGWERLLSSGKAFKSRPLPRGDFPKSLPSLSNSMSHVPTPASTTPSVAASGVSQRMAQHIGNVAGGNVLGVPGVLVSEVDPLAPSPAGGFNNASPLDGRFLGQGWSGLARRFEIVAPSIIFSAGTKKDDIIEEVLEWDPVANALISQFIEFNAYAEIAAIDIRVQPGTALTGRSIEIITAVRPANGVAPSGRDSVLRLPSASRRFHVPWTQGVLAAGVERTITLGEYGVQSVIKPVPFVGGAPVLVVYLRGFACADIGSSGALAADINISVIVKRY